MVHTFNFVEFNFPACGDCSDVEIAYSCIDNEF